MARIYKCLIYFKFIRYEVWKMITHSFPSGCHRSVCPEDIYGGPSYRKTPRKL